MFEKLLETDFKSCGNVTWNPRRFFCNVSIFFWNMVFYSGGCLVVSIFVSILCVFGGLKQLTNIYMNVFNAEDFRFWTFLLDVTI